MKGKRLQIFVFLILCSSALNAQWVNLYNPDTNPMILSPIAVRFYDFNKGFIAGQNNLLNICILRTTNNGTNWDTSYTSIADTGLFTDLTFIDSAKVIAVGNLYMINRGIIAKTNDFGNTWIDTITSASLNAMSFPSHNTGYIASEYGTIYKTLDAGNTWDSLSTGTSYNLVSIYFINDTIGFVCGGNSILKTINGGISWTVNSSGIDYFKIVFPSDSVGYCCTSADNTPMDIYKTLDQGTTWALQSNIPNVTYLSSVFFSDINTGYLTSQLYFFKTSDGGVTWNRQSCSAYNFYDWMSDVFFLNNDTGFASGGETFWRTTTGGDVPLSANDLQSSSKIDVLSAFPNPANKNLTITFEVNAGEQIDLKIFNAIGQQVFNQKLSKNKLTTLLDVSQFSEGMYFIHAATGKQIVYDKKFIISK